MSKQFPVTLDEILEKYPAPWHEGESQTCRTKIVDAGYKEVVSVVSWIGQMSEEPLAELLVKAVNEYAESKKGE